MRGQCRNPGRGCGTKKKDAFYLESDITDEGEGDLWAFAMLLGDGHDVHIPLKYPARQMTIVNPAATIVARDNILGDMAFLPETDEET